MRQRKTRSHADGIILIFADSFALLDSGYDVLSFI